MKRLQSVLYAAAVILALIVAPVLIEGAYPAAMGAIALAAACVMGAERCGA